MRNFVNFVSFYRKLFAAHFQGGIATFLTMPLDVMKTRMMNAEPGTYKVCVCSDNKYHLFK